MRTLPLPKPDPLFHHHHALVLVRFTRVDSEWYLANRFADVRTAISDGDPFEAHRVLGPEARPVIINPVHVVTVEDLYQEPKD